MTEQASAETVADAESLLERHYAAMMRIASYRGAKEAEVSRVIVESVVAASGIEGNEAELLLFRALITAVAELERQTLLPQDWEAEPEPALQSGDLEPPGTRWEGWFKDDPRSFKGLERRRLGEARRTAAAAVSRLPLAQRVVVVLRDVAAFAGDDIDRLLNIDSAVQRVLLHSGRSRVRRALELLSEESVTA